MTVRHLIVIGESDVGANVPDHEMNEVHTRLGSVRNELAARGIAFVRCRTPRQLASVIQGYQDLDILDIYYHSSPGVMFLGSADNAHVLFQTNRDKEPLIGARYARTIERSLGPNARVRLLGCQSGHGQLGRLLLLKLAYELGRQRVVFGSICAIDPSHFHAISGVFDCQRALFSSLAAIDAVAPTWYSRENPPYPYARSEYLE
ncbi:MAG: hypothetical protein KF773_10390 [Deltaproteobacteria bacterium]|nr:hypothetical protein [Deltaproteobacteria bacterium]MCW5808804.1 hypothetical protein [Deltaproteobacteria bacterium]